MVIQWRTANMDLCILTVIIYLYVYASMTWKKRVHHGLYGKSAISNQSFKIYIFLIVKITHKSKWNALQCVIQTCVASDKETARQVEQIDSIKKNSALYHFYFFQLKLKKNDRKMVFNLWSHFTSKSLYNEFVQKKKSARNNTSITYQIGDTHSLSKYVLTIWWRA